MELEINTTRGEGLSREPSKNCSEKKEVLIEVTYQDHVLFKNCDSSTIHPYIRKAVGWLVCEDSGYLLICFDKPLEYLEKIKEGGLLILKSTVLEIREIMLEKAFKRKNAVRNRLKKPYN